MYDKIAISAYILKIVENDPFLRLQMRAKEMFNFFKKEQWYVNTSYLLQQLTKLF